MTAEPTTSSAGVVCAAFPDAAEAGAAMLRRGGNAVDAACAAAWALAVCEPAESGLGGQTIMLIREPDGACVVLDGHSRAPRGVTRSRVGRRAQDVGAAAMTVPSTVATLAAAQRRFGRLTLAEALGPAVALAEEGYRITALQRTQLRWMVRRWPVGSVEAATFLRDDRESRLPRVGEVMRQPRLAATLGRLAARGAEEFYHGDMAREIVNDVQNRGGVLCEEDLRGLDLPAMRAVLGAEYRRWRVISAPPPSGGLQVLLALRLLEERLDPSCGEEEWRRELALATLAAFKERERWADHPADLRESELRWLVSRERVQGILDRAAGLGGADCRDRAGEAGNTTHLCAADKWGGVVSLTQSIQSVFGAKTVHPTLGFVYNNYLSTCVRRPHPYRLKGGCLPQSNAAPTLVLDAESRPVLALGSAGSRRITSSVVQVISGVLDRGMSLEEAVAAPRAHALLSGALWHERSVPGGCVGALFGMGLRAKAASGYRMGAVHALAWDEHGRVRGSADPRRDGRSAVA